MIREELSDPRIGDGAGPSRGRQKTGGFAQWRAKVHQWIEPMRAKVAVGLLASVCMSPAMAQFSCESVYGVERDTGRVLLVSDDGEVTPYLELDKPGVNPFGIGAGGVLAYLGQQEDGGANGLLAGSVVVYNSVTEQVLGVTPPAVRQEGMSTFNAGAVNPVNGWFYMATPNTG